MNCDRCGHPVAVTPADPLCWTSLGRHHHACMLAAWRDHDRVEVDRQEAASARRSAAARARWAAAVDAGQQPLGVGRDAPGTP